VPLWKIYHPENAYTANDKKAIAEAITAIYPLPKFYVGVVFQEVPKHSFYIGGEPAGNFVRIWVDHIARQFVDESLKERFFAAVNRRLAPYLADRGLHWEIHVDETPFGLWRIQGLQPPLPDSPAENKWREENMPSAY